MGLSTWFKQSERYLRSFRVIWRNVSNCGVKMQKKWHKIGFLKNKNLNFFKSLKWFWTIFQHYFTRINKNSEKRNVGELSGGEISVRGNSPEGNSPGGHSPGAISPRGESSSNCFFIERLPPIGFYSGLYQGIFGSTDFTKKPNCSYCT